MILSAYKSNQQAVLLFLPAVLAVFWLFSFFGLDTIDSVSGQLFGGKLLAALGAYPVLSQLLCVLIVLGEAVLLNRVFNKNDFAAKENYLPAFFYIIFTGYTLGLQHFSEVLVANLFVIFFISRLLSIYRQKHVYSEVFDAGMLLGIAFLFYPPVICLLPAVWSALTIIRSFKWREWVIPIVGFSIPLCFAAVYFYWTDQLHFLWELPGWQQGAGMTTLSESSSISNWISWGLLALLGFVSIYHVLQSVVSSTVRARNVKMVLLSFAGVCALAYVLGTWLPGAESRFQILAVPLSMLIPFYLVNTRFRFLSGLLFYTLLGFLLVNFYLDYSIS